MSDIERNKVEKSALCMMLLLGPRDMDLVMATTPCLDVVYGVIAPSKPSAQIPITTPAEVIAI